jgi:hypothetical protein
MTDVSPTPAHPFTPPTDLDDIDRPEMRSSWPTAIGTIAIVFGALGALGWLYSGASPFLFKWFGGTFDENEPGMKAALAWQTWSVLLSLLAAALAVLLLVVGVRLVRRRRRALRAGIGWAILRMLLAVAHAAVFSQMAQQQFAEMQNDPNIAPMRNIVGPATAIFWIVWGCALPIFLLIWFGRRKIKDEVTTWP